MPALPPLARGGLAAVPLPPTASASGQQQAARRMLLLLAAVDLDCGYHGNGNRSTDLMAYELKYLPNNRRAVGGKHGTRHGAHYWDYTTDDSRTLRTRSRR